MRQVLSWCDHGGIESILVVLLRYIPSSRAFGSSGYSCKPEEILLCWIQSQGVLDSTKD